MATIRKNRIGQENIKSIDQIEQYISTNYLKQIQERIEIINTKKKELEEKTKLYNSITESNNALLNSIINNNTYIQIEQNITYCEPCIEEFITIVEYLLSRCNNKNIITTNNLGYKQDISDNDKVNKIDGEFTSLQLPLTTSGNAAVNKEYLIKELEKIQRVPTPLQPLKYLATNEGGNLIWR